MNTEHTATEIQCLLNTDAASEYLKIKFGIDRTPKTLVKYRIVGGGPTYHKIGKREVGYMPADLDAFAREIISPPIRATNAA